MPAMHDVVIVGGGPAGLYAGARLAAAGFHTTLLEEHRRRRRARSLHGRAGSRRFDEFNLSRRSLLEPADDRTLLVSRRAIKSAIRAAASKPSSSIAARSIRICPRPRSTSGLADRAKARARRRCRSIGRASPSEPPSGDVRARVAILACGANYALHRQVGLGMPRMFLHTAQIELPARHLGDVELHFGSEIAPKGFGWVVPVIRGTQHCARIGVMCDDDAPRYFERLAARIGDRWGIDESASRRPRQKILPLAPISRTYGDRLLAIGDAAGLVKPTTGGGIYYSLVSAALAADVLADALPRNDLSAERLAPYERQLARAAVGGVSGAAQAAPASRIA